MTKVLLFVAIIFFGVMSFLAGLKRGHVEPDRQYLERAKTDDGRTVGCWLWFWNGRRWEYVTLGESMPMGIPTNNQVVLSVIRRESGGFQCTRHDGQLDPMVFRTVKEAAETAVEFLPDEVKNYKADL